MAYFYTGRIDMIEEEYDMLDLFDELISKFSQRDEDDVDFWGFAFEDKSKTGLSTKPHYHFFMKSDYKQDTIRKYITKLGFPGSLASIRLQDINDPKWYYYIFKQGDVTFTSLSEEEIEKYIVESLKYNTCIKPKLNTFKDHMETYLETLDKTLSYQPISGYDQDATFDNFERTEKAIIIRDLIIKYIGDNVGEFQLPCRQTFTHWVVMYTKTLCPQYMYHITDLYYTTGLI